MDKKALYDLSYGMYVLSVSTPEKPTGCIVNTVIQISSDPVTVAVSVNKDNYTNRCIKEAGRFSVSILTEASDPSIIGTFGFQTGREVKKFDDIPYTLACDDIPVLSGNLSSWLCLELISSIDVETHTVFVARVIDAAKITGDKPMTYSYYHSVLKGKTAKNAPTYQETAPDGADESEYDTYICPICGYEHKEPPLFSALPDDWVCPICGAPKKHFYKKPSVSI